MIYNQTDQTKFIASTCLQKYYFIKYVQKYYPKLECQVTKYANISNETKARLHFKLY